MTKVVCAIVAVLAYFVLAESLICNQCNFALLGYCLNGTNVTCSTNTSVCFTGRLAFASLPSFAGLNSQGCQEPAACTNSNGTLLGATYQITTTCCSTDNCNPVTLNGATSTTKLSLVAVLASAMLASVWSTL